MRNIIDAILTLFEIQNFDLTESTNKDFKKYIMDIFADSFYREDDFKEVFSYIGTQSETPDLILRDGDAVVIKSIKVNSDNDILENENSRSLSNIKCFLFTENYKEIAEVKPLNGEVLLNNVPPMQILQMNDPLISKNCRDILYWEDNSLFEPRPPKRDIIYVVGGLEENQLRCLSMVYGRDYCASNDYYNNIRRKIKNLYQNEEMIQNNLETVKELAQIDEFDPLGLTGAKLYVNWQIKNPWHAFHYIYRRNNNTKFDFMCIINYDKWITLENRELLLAAQETCENLTISPVRIKNPDNPEERRDAVLITYEIPEKKNLLNF